MSEQRDDVDLSPNLAIHLAGRAVHRALWIDFNLRAAWPWIDPTLRRCMVQLWLTPQRKALKHLGYTREGVVEALVVDEPRHRLWSVYESAQIQRFAQGAPEGIESWVMTVDTEPLAPDVERLALYAPPAAGDVADGPWVTLVMRYAGGAGWRLLSFDEDVPVPTPGWPPTL
ncbi:hypothetical protein [Streptomyces sp. IBSBF 2435]|uniref:hypothetical protein n=1 Tax=Streptomyces sp. IBSBF 2435 TaxID=2903531 RepID=UPI002FDC6896